ncbi:MAG: hypothetical protein ACLR02_06000 [Clostridium sp.]|nr:hypothetical protein [Clostridium sp.]
MLSNLLQKLKNILSDFDKELTEDQVYELSKILEHFSGGIIPMPVIRRELKLTTKETENLMVFLETKGILRSKYRVYCPDSNLCAKETIYNDIRDIPKKKCDRCDNGCLYVENIAVVFEVI